MKAYHVILKTEYVIYNPLDVSYKNTTTIRVTPDPYEGTPPQEIGRILSIKIGKTEHVKDQILITEAGFSTELSILLDPDATADYIFEYSMWLAIGKPHIIRPLRMVEQFFLDIVSRCGHTPQVQTEGDTRVVSLLFNEPLQLGPVQGVSPGEKAFSFVLLEPAPRPAVAAAPAADLASTNA